ncbi:sigma-54-dependent Fis family transcriptional regulator [Burkholderia sp. Bp8963]|uniref:sigma 54-interacting transcriptional regulator n=1 Tax=Burkholderia sp. Bp8963 TaxID=2184547 RepID=UPI000F598938|nr:sigma-54 dependent transcriptional regulator [Burkholderia sp. Bp8963]RQS71534.1 sigma-54-dependent Fis family transcriptional regulator [Burkholderia sp. Bp8963]
MNDFARLNLIGQSPCFLAALELIRKYANSTAAVLIKGETGTGKELAARALHYLSGRRDLPFVPVNSGAIPEHLIESELFGHVRGAFTDARETRHGLITEARGGTLFLDEVEALSARAQVALLRFLQDREYRPVGGTLLRNADVRVIAATNLDLAVLARKGLFRCDLLYRLDVLPLNLPPLRERAGDVTVLAETFVERLNRQGNGPVKALLASSREALNRHAWPGNVRELENLIQREYVLAGDARHIDLTPADDGSGPVALFPAPVSADESFKAAKARAVAEFERTYMFALLSRSGGNLSLASRLSGKDRSDIGKLLRKHGIERQRFTGAAQHNPE